MSYLVQTSRSSTFSIESIALKPLIVVHFFNRQSDVLENSIQGLLRPLLFQTLRGQTAPIEATSEKHHGNRKIYPAYPWTSYDLEDRFSILLQHRDCPPILTFVDALDEHHGEDIEFAEFVDRVSLIIPHRHRFYVSSRPYPDFKFQFVLYRDVFHMDEYTSNDIYIYTTSKFEQMTRITEEYYDDIISTIMISADSIFLMGETRSRRVT